MSSIGLTSHARLRMAERWTGDDPVQAANEAWAEGAHRENTRGAFRRLLDDRWEQGGKDAAFVIHAGYIWVYRDNVLLTMYPLNFGYADRVECRHKKHVKKQTVYTKRVNRANRRGK